jgi:peptidoglycan hydrolase CwlO-like protein
MDEPWLERVQETLKKLWKELKTTKRSAARAKQALQDAMETGDASTLARVALQEEVTRTKRVAQQVVATYQRQAQVAVIERTKIMQLNFLLFALIIFLVAALIVKSN